MVLHIFKKKKTCRFVRKIRSLNSNILKRKNILNNINIRKKFRISVYKKSKFWGLKNKKKRLKIYQDLELDKCIANNNFFLLAIKPSGFSNSFYGIFSILFDFKNNAYLKKQIMYNENFLKKINKVKKSLSFFILKLFWGYEINSMYKFTLFADEDNYMNPYIIKNNINIGSIIPIFLLPQGEVCFNINDNNKKWKYSTSAGTYSVFTDYSKDRKKALIELPSGVAKRININVLCVVGRCANIFSKYRIFGKASYFMFVKKKRQSVRGVAMNPVDHPNGGRSKIKKPFLSPWGWVAKNKK